MSYRLPSKQAYGSAGACSCKDLAGAMAGHGTSDGRTTHRHLAMGEKENPYKPQVLVDFFFYQ